MVACHVLLALVATLTVTSPAFAQDADRTPPTLSFEPLEEGRRGDTQVFSARVADEEGAVERVTLHFRASGTSVYTPLEMAPLAGTDIYTVSVDDLGPDVTGIEYYLEAVDEAGNRSIEGFAFDPLERRLAAPEGVAGADTGDAAPEPTTERSAPIEADGMSTRRKILYGVLGIVAVGALAAAAGSGGGGDDSSEVPVTILADPL